MNIFQNIKCYFNFHDYELQIFDEERRIFDLGKEVFRYKRIANIFLCKYCGKEGKNA